MTIREPARKRRGDLRFGRSAEGEPDDLSDTVQYQLARLLAVARRILGSDELALDAVQEAFVALWRERPEAERRAPWLVRTVIHRSLHARRGAERRRRWEGRAGLEASLARPCRLCDAERELLDDALRSELGRALGALEQGQRRVFELREIDGLDYGAIAATLGIPVGTVRSRLHRARRALQAALHEWA